MVATDVQVCSFVDSGEGAQDIHEGHRGHDRKAGIAITAHARRLKCGVRVIALPPVASATPSRAARHIYGYSVIAFLSSFYCCCYARHEPNATPSQRRPHAVGTTPRSTFMAAMEEAVSLALRCVIVSDVRWRDEIHVARLSASVEKRRHRKW